MCSNDESTFLKKNKSWKKKDWLYSVKSTDASIQVPPYLINNSDLTISEKWVLLIFLLLNLFRIYEGNLIYLFKFVWLIIIISCVLQFFLIELKEALYNSGASSNPWNQHQKILLLYLWEWLYIGISNINFS